MPKNGSLLNLAATSCAWCWLTATGARATTPSTFADVVQPFIAKNCLPCHNSKLATAGLNLEALNTAASPERDRERWEQVVSRIQNGEMPPPGVPRPSDRDLQAMLAWLNRDFLRQDRPAVANPGRIVARRLNRSEYSNTIRDLLGVSFHADEEFPPDDTGYGFDDIASVLTISPTLMQKYLQAAEHIASQAVGGDPLPNPGLFIKRSQLRRFNVSTVEFKDRVEFDADYVLRVRLVGHRGDNDPPVTVRLSIDGTPVKTREVSTHINAVNKQSGETQRNFVEMRTFLTQGDHVFRSEFLNDQGIENIAESARMTNKRNIFPDTMEIAGPFPPSSRHDVRKKILTCDPAAAAQCVNEILRALAYRAYRGNAGKADVEELTKVYSRAQAQGFTPPESLQFAITAMLVSPKFLFRMEQDPKTGAVGRISDLELATRLSYFLWSSTPDDELLSLAAANRLHQPSVLDAQMKRLMADPKSAAFAENFSGQWLEIRSLDATQPDAGKFPEWTPELREAMRTETTMFFEAILRENRPVSDFLDAKYTFLNETLAKHYGIPGVRGPEFRRVELSGDQRSGVITQGSVLRVTSYPNRTSVVLRGKYLLENILGAPPPLPPPDVPRLDESSVGVEKSLRQQMEQHRSDPVCASCHSKMDVLGFGLENYDAIGRWRTTDGKFPIESGGVFPNGKSFRGPDQMKAILRESLSEFTRCLTEKLLIYALGRGLEPYDRPTVQALVREAGGQNYGFQSVVTGIVHSTPFQQRSGKIGAEPLKETSEK